MRMKRLRPVHPGDVLVRDFMRPLELTARRLAKSTGLSMSTIDRIARRRHPVTARWHCGCPAISARPRSSGCACITRACVPERGTCPTFANRRHRHSYTRAQMRDVTRRIASGSCYTSSVPDTNTMTSDRWRKSALASGSYWWGGRESNPRPAD